MVGGRLKEYQVKGLEWLVSLYNNNLNGILADEMGLGKTIQTLALLQYEHELNPGTTSLLIMPTSLIYNWHIEAKKFTPNLNVLVYTGSDRIKDVSRFSKYDLIITSYGISRIDASKILSQFFFNYVVLDESQAIKNPD